MKFSVGIAALASVAAASPFYMEHKQRAPTALGVKLQMVGNSEVKATFTNNGKKNLKVLKTGTILDNKAVQKARITTGAQNVKFDGLRLQVSTSSLTEKNFQRIPAGSSIDVTFDIAEVHDLSNGGEFGILADNVFSFANEDSTKLVGSVPFYSNKITTKVNGFKAAKAHMTFHQRRFEVQSDCTGDKLKVTQEALKNCASIAKKAQQAAVTGPGAKLEEYFKSSNNQTRSVVNTVFGKIAEECGTTDKGVAKYYCSDTYKACEDGVLAYTLPSQSFMAYCDLYFKELPPVTKECHKQDQAGTNIHEATHLTQIKGTDDFGGYGYEFVKSLTAEQNMNHADTYALFANAIDLNC